MIYATLKEVFPTVLLLDATQSNDVIIALNREKPITTGADNIEAVGDARGLKRVKKALRKKIVGPVDGWTEAEVLTDDRAPVEMAWDLMALEFAG